MNRFLCWCAAIAGTVALQPATSYALPKYAAKEGKPCSYCHINPAGGGSFTAAGLYYVTHGHSFAGYAPAAAAGGSASEKTGPPAFKSLWKMDLAPGVTRVASAVLSGDKKPSLLVLGADNKLTVTNLTGAKPVDEGSIDLGPKAAQFAVGRFAAGKPAIIAVPGAVWYRDDDHFATKAVPKLTEISGRAGFADGTDTIIETDTPKPSSWSIDLSASDNDALKPGRSLVSAAEAKGVYSNTIARLGADNLQKLGVPQQAAGLGVMGLFDPRGDKSIYVWVPWVTDGDNHVVVGDVAWLSGGASAKPIWESPKQADKIVDVFYGPDPKGGKEPGFLVLSATGADGTGRSLEFFALD